MPERELAQEILELLARRPDGLTILEIVGRFRTPAKDVIRAIAVMQRRRWLRTGAGDAVRMGDGAPAAAR